MIGTRISIAKYALYSLAAGLLLAFSAAPAAQAQSRPYKPHQAVIKTVTPDPSLKAFSAKVRAAAAKSDLPAIEAFLSADFAVVSCKADATVACDSTPPRASAGEPQQTPAQRLRAGLCCPGIPPDEVTDELRAETVTGIIMGALESEQFSEHETPGLVCSPAWPIYDRKAAEAMVKASRSSADFLRYASQNIRVRTKPDPATPVAFTLAKGALVPLLSDVATHMPDGWYALALPDGKIGFSDDLGLEELAPSGVCLRKTGNEWKISLVITLE
ncbi:MAG: hypothetical protein FJX29_12235 [Alphaproteobacteria bacterium]|nr:hypothetical protein [Alphaproteobacteria bacterium]